MEITVSWVLSWIQTISFNIPVRYPREQCCFQHATKDVLVDFYVSSSKLKDFFFLSYSSMICTTSLGALLMNLLGFDPTHRKSRRNFTHFSSNSRVSRSYFSQFWVATACSLPVHLAAVCRIGSTRVFLRFWSRSSFIDVIMVPFGSRSNTRVCSKRDRVINDHFVYRVFVPVVHLYNIQKWWSLARKVTERILINRGNIWGV